MAHLVCTDHGKRSVVVHRLFGKFAVGVVLHRNGGKSAVRCAGDVKIDGKVFTPGSIIEGERNPRQGRPTVIKTKTKTVSA